LGLRGFVLGESVEGVGFPLIVSDVAVTERGLVKTMVVACKVVNWRTPCQLRGRRICQWKKVREYAYDVPRNKMLLSDQNGITTPED
jgi:hypothetical protein